MFVRFRFRFRGLVIGFIRFIIGFIGLLNRFWEFMLFRFRIGFIGYIGYFGICRLTPKLLRLAGAAKFSIFILFTSKG